MKKFNSKSCFGYIPMLLLVVSSLFSTRANATYHFSKATTCEDVQSNYPYGPISETTEFQEGATIYSWMEITNVYGTIKGKFEWIKPDGYIYTSATTSTFHVTNGGWVRMYAPQLFYNTYGQWQIRFYISHNGGAYQLQDTKTCNYGGCFCPAYYDPVCGADGNTYGNACEANCAGVSYTTGACNTCICPAVFDPVCGADGITYGNACEASCAGVSSYTAGECTTVGTTCDLLARITFNTDLCSQCLSEIAVYEYNGQSYLVYDGSNAQCSDALTTILDCNTGAQVCLIGGIAGLTCGNLFDFNSAVKTEVVVSDDCSGGGCVCPAVVDPVCGSDGNTYNNSCEAACAGVFDYTAGACNTGGTTCDLLTRIRFDPDLCSQCLTEIAVYEYHGQSYLVYDSRNSHCSDALTTVVNCDTGAQVCQMGGIAGFTCGNLFNFNDAIKTEVVLTADCGGSCICPAVVDPVCGSDGNTYNNSCEAACAGVSDYTHGACNSGCACTNQHADYFCDDFQEYDPWQKLGPQSSCWTTWTGHEGGAKDGDIKRNNTTTNQYLKIKGNNPHGGGHQDIVLQLGDRKSGCYHLDFKIWLFSGHKGYYNILHKFNANNSNNDDQWASNVYFDGHGSGRLIVQNVSHYFTYKMGEWINVSQHFDLDNDLTELHIDGKKVRRWRFSDQANTSHVGLKRLSAVNFYPVNSAHEFYIDEVVFEKASNFSPPAESRNSLSEAFGSVETIVADLKVLPNPFDQSINIQIPEELINGELLISDQLGRVVRQIANLEDQVGQTMTLDVSDLESGIYIVRVASRGKVYMQKIVKQSL